MDQVVDNRTDTVERKAVTVDDDASTTDPAAPAPETAGEEAPARSRRLPDWWHRDHPVFVPLAGFFTGMVFIIVVPGAYAAVLKAVVGYKQAEELFPYVLAALAVPLALLVPHHTRRFGRYMLFGVVATAVVVIGVAGAVLWFLYNRDG